MAALPHLVLGLVSKQTAPKVPTIILLIAPLLLDLLGLVFYLLHFEVILSHSLIMAVIWASAVGFICLLIYRDLRSSIVIGILILSHWMIDFITWPMTAIFPKSTGIPVFLDTSVLVGLGLYNSVIWIVILEGLPLLGIVLYIIHKVKEKKEESLMVS